MTINAFPLQWPTGWKRATSRKEARFSTKGYGTRARPLSIADGLERVLCELDHMGYTRDDVVISTDVPLRLDGLPRSDRAEPADPGAAVYWRTRRGENKVMAIDIYDRVADNLAAVAATLEAMRAIDRHGGAAILERAFTGFTALPAPSAGREWWDVLECRPDASEEVIRAQFKRLASQYHPDKPGGSHARMAELNAAFDAAAKERTS